MGECGVRVAFARVLVRVGDAYRRILALFLTAIGPRAAYSILAVLARWLYRLFDPLRLRSEAQCGAALADKHSAGEIARIAEQAFVHRAWNLADLMLADRLIHRGTYNRYGGRVPEPYLGMLLDAQGQRHPLILVTGYYGPFDLLPLFLGYNGIRTGDRTCGLAIVSLPPVIEVLHENLHGRFHIPHRSIRAESPLDRMQIRQIWMQELVDQPTRRRVRLLLAHVRQFRS